MSHYTGSVPEAERPDDWRLNALCATDQFAGRRDLWFPTPGDERTIAEARSVCAECLVRQACLVEALREEGGVHPDRRHGIRAGMTGYQRRSLYEKLRARQRKAREARQAAA